MQFFEIHRYPTKKRFPVYGSINRLYIDLSSNELYYWEDGQYVQISAGELDQANRDEVTEIITAHTTAITNRLTELETSKVDKTTMVNGKELSTDITLYGSDISSDMFQDESVDDVLERLNQGLTDSVPQTRKVAGKALSSDVLLNASDIQFGQSTVESELDHILDTKADQATTLAGYGITDAYTKAEVDNRTTAVYRVKGNVPTYASLPSTGQITGDVYNVVDTGINYVWNGTEWDDIGGVEAMATASEDGLMSKEDFVKLQALYTRSDLDNKLALKADKTYVDSQDALKVDKNANITGATKTKITYDSKGLVTAGADLVESDIPPLSPSKITQSTTARFVTDTEKATWNNKVDKSEKGVANGYASLDGEAKVPSSQLPIGVPYITTAPTSANTNGNLIMVVLTSEPTTKYAGYFYIITEE